jgi:hypothetical protein
MDHQSVYLLYQRKDHWADDPVPSLRRVLCALRVKNLKYLVADLSSQLFNLAKILEVPLFELTKCSELRLKLGINHFEAPIVITQ